MIACKKDDINSATDTTATYPKTLYIESIDYHSEILTYTGDGLINITEFSGDSIFNSAQLGHFPETLVINSLDSGQLVYGANLCDEQCVVETNEAYSKMEMVYIEDTVIFRITDSLWGMPFNIDLITVGDVNTRLKIPYYVYRHIDRHGTTGTSSSRGTVNGVRDFYPANR
ncbi:MAG: hypothetical protein HRT72_09440 [Flavobacteriales bacterium]|nr:hypothetical protein [Flavobacteriales bacterium]